MPSFWGWGRALKRQIFVDIRKEYDIEKNHFVCLMFRQLEHQMNEKQVNGGDIFVKISILIIQKFNHHPKENFIFHLFIDKHRV